MRSSLLITIIIMGFLSVGFTLFSGEVYLQQTLDNRRQAFLDLVELEVHNRWDKLKEDTRAMSLSVLSSDDFREALEGGQQESVVQALNEHFHRAYVTLGILDLKKIIVYNSLFEKTFESVEGDVIEGDVCASVKGKILSRKGSDRFKVLNKVCVVKNKSAVEEVRLVTVVPIGGWRLKGYLLIVVDPLFNISKSEEGLGIPVMIKNISGDILFKSEKWPDTNLMENTMLVHYGNRAGNKKPVANFYFATNIKELNDKLLNTRVKLVSFVVIATLLAMVIALGLFRQTIIIPLEKISDYLNKVRLDKAHLGDDLKISGCKELVNLADEMCGMSHELGRVHSELEKMAFSDALTGIPNRALLFDRLEQMTLRAKRDKQNNEFMLLMMDMNRFKAVNDELGHHVGDLLLVAVAQRLQTALRESDTVARLGGDEFAIILHAVSESEVAVAVADKITALMNELFVIEGYELDVGMSIGISRFPIDGEDSEAVMHSADMAMYHAKRNKIPYVFFSEELEK